MAESEQQESSDKLLSSSPSRPVKGILKKGKQEKAGVVVRVEPESGPSGGVQWDEMNILMTEHPPGKDYGHMKIDEPKTPFHEMSQDEDEDEGEGEGGKKGVAANILAERVMEAAEHTSTSRWDAESSGSDLDPEELLTEDQKEHRKQFQDWRKKHYNEFYAVQRAKELIQKDEEELARLEEEERKAKELQQDQPMQESPSQGESPESPPQEAMQEDPVTPST